MVKSKKMSKTSIAVIILALLLVLSMVLGLTGAWFTKSGQNETAATNPASTLYFGKLGDVVVSAQAGTWKAAGGAAIPASGQAGHREVLMPGDEVKTGAVSFSYAVSETEADNGTEASVYYLIYDGNNLYTLNESDNVNHTGLFVPSSSGVGTIAKGATITVPGEVIAIQCTDGESVTAWYALDGRTSNNSGADGSKEHPFSSFAIPTNQQGVKLDTFNGANASVKGAAYYFSSAGITYKMAVVQITNMPDNAATPRAVLLDILGYTGA